jgi:hypothetical protein
MTNAPISPKKEYVAVRDENGRFLPGTIAPGRPKGRVGGRAKALLLLDSILGEDEVQNRMASELREAIMDDPVKFFRQIIMPLLPQEIKMKLGEEGAISWVRLSTMFPTQDSEPSMPVIDVSEPSAADDDGERPYVSPPSYSTEPEAKPQATTPG